MAQHGPRMTQNDPKWPKNDPKWPKITPKWPKNDARIHAIFLTEKAVPQTGGTWDQTFKKMRQGPYF